MKEFYHYTLKSNVENIKKTGMSSNISYFTTAEYFSASIAGAKIGVMAHNIDCVLKFRDDGSFRFDGEVPYANRFDGGADQWSHPAKPKPIAIRNISDREWTAL